MRIFDREAFMTMPKGTLFQRIDKHGNTQGLLIKWRTIYHEGKGIDWYEQDFSTVEGDGPWDVYERNGEMMVEGESHPLSNIIGRDGLFDHDQLYLVMEKDDVRVIKDAVDWAWSVVCD